MINDPRPVRFIAQDIFDDWIKAPHLALQSIEAMLTMDSIDDAYFLEEGRWIVVAFLSNAGQWKGPTARRLKQELRNLLKSPPSSPGHCRAQSLPTVAHGNDHGEWVMDLLREASNGNSAYRTRLQDNLPRRKRSSSHVTSRSALRARAVISSCPNPSALIDSNARFARGPGH